MVAACTNGKCAMSRKLSIMRPAPTRAGGHEVVVQEAVGVRVRKIETFTDRFVGREEHQAADLGEPGR